MSRIISSPASYLISNLPAMGRKTGYTLRDHQWFGLEPDAVQKEQVRLECLPLRQPTVLWENLANAFECPDTLLPLPNHLHHLYYLQTFSGNWSDRAYYLHRNLSVFHNSPPHSWELATDMPQISQGVCAWATCCNGRNSRIQLTAWAP